MPTNRWLMITVYELERKVPSYYGLCGLRVEKLIYVRSWSDFQNNFWINMFNMNEAGWRLRREREFPTRLKTGGFTKRISPIT